MLSKIDGQRYPELDQILGRTSAKAKPQDLPSDLAEASANARSWGAALQGMNRAAGVRSQATSDPEN